MQKQQQREHAMRELHVQGAHRVGHPEPAPWKPEARLGRAREVGGEGAKHHGHERQAGGRRRAAIGASRHVAARDQSRAESARPLHGHDQRGEDRHRDRVVHGDEGAVGQRQQHDGHPHEGRHDLERHREQGGP